MTELYDEHLLFDGGIQHRRVSQMKAQDYHPEYLETRIVESESQGHAYLLGKIDVLSTEFENADVVADNVTKWVCSCDDYFFNRSDGVEDGGRTPDELGECKHIRSAVKVERARVDGMQESLGGVPADD